MDYRQRQFFMQVNNDLIKICHEIKLFITHLKVNLQ